MNSQLTSEPRPAKRPAADAALWNTPALFWLAIALALSVEYWCLGPYSYLRIHDNGDSFITRTAIAKAGLLSHGPAYWFPYMAGGVDRLAHDLPYTQFAFLIALAFPLWLSYAITVVLQCFLAGYGAFLLCRDVLRLDDLGSRIAGFGFAVFVSGLLYMQFGLYLLPLAIFALARLNSSSLSAPRALVLAALTGLIFGLASSFTITLPFSLALTIAWFALLDSLGNARRWALCCAFAAAAILPHTRTVWALLANAGGSHRASRVFADIHAVFSTLSDTPPLVWVFAPILLLTAFATKSWRDRRWVALASLYAFCGAGFVILDLGKFYVARSLSFLNGFQIDRFYEFSPFFGAVATGYAISRRKREQRSIVLLPAAILLLVAANAKYEHLKTLVSQGNAAYNYQSPEVQRLATAPTGLDTLWRVATVPGSIHPAYANAYGLETIDGYVNLYPKRFQRFWGSLIDPAIAGDASLRHYFSDWGNRIYLFQAKAAGTRWPFRNSLLSLANTKYIISSGAIQDPRLEAIDHPDRPRSDRFAAALRSGLFSGRRDLFIYLNRDWFPRAFVAGAVRSLPDLDSLNRELAATDLPALRGTVFIEQQFRYLLGPLDVQTGPHEVTLTDYQADRLALRVSGPIPGVLIVSNSYSPLWECRVDGRKVPVVPADGTFWGVRIEAGDHRVVFDYAPPYARLPF
jgi:hypothetical protein